jgi:membrane associated rhomboid family serine protease
LLVELYLLVAFGREIEIFLGRKSFVKLYAGLLITPPLVLAAAGWAGWPSIYWGSSALHFGIFVAFALLYPTAEILFSIQARWVALALLAINSLQCLALADYTSLTALGVDFEVEEVALLECVKARRSWNIFHTPTSQRCSPCQLIQQLTMGLAG